jgi:SAM-dependent methyltransferase
MTNKQDWAERMSRDWDARASRDALHWTVNCVPEGKWQVDDYLQTGEDTLAYSLDAFMDGVGISPEKLKVFEIGCGAGRITCGLARRFKKVYGLDVSGEMVKAAMEMVEGEGYTNVNLFKGDGFTLKPQRANSIDVVYSVIVLQHIPSVDIQLGYLEEVGRVLKPGGLFAISLYSDEEDYSRRLAWWKGARLAGPHHANELVNITLDNFETSMQTPVPCETVDKTLDEAGLELLHETGRHTHTWWIYGRKA